MNIYVILELLSHKCNPLITTVVDGSVFKKNIKNLTWKKNVRKRYYFGSGITIMKL